MSDVGYLYVLANSAMPGLVKVGKTNRTSTDRAAELSRVTGIPTPFIVVYEQLFADCSAAERFVHTYLESRDFRVSHNREFFNAPANDVIRAIIAAPGAISSDNVQPDEDAYGQIDRPAWTALYEQADENFYGLGSTLQDHQLALKLYKQAAKLGCTVAHARIGAMIEAGQGTKPDLEQAAVHFKEGAKQGHRYCYWRLALLFQKMEHTVNAEKCAAEFLKSASDISPYEEELDYIHYGLTVLHTWLLDDVWPSEPIRQMISYFKAPLLAKNLELIDMLEQDGRHDTAASYTRIRAFLQRF